MESIQLAQMLADLSDLNAAQEAHAAVALVSANKTIHAAQTTVSGSASGPTSDPSSKPLDAAPVRPGQLSHQRMGSSSIISRTASPAKFDKFGRRILTPPMSRTNSAQGSIPGTPRREAEQLEDDVERATSLMALYEIRAKLKEQDSTSLFKLREKIAALQARQHSEKKEGAGESRLSRYAYPKASA